MMKDASIQMDGWTEIVQLEVINNMNNLFNVSYVVLNFIKFYSCTEKSFVFILKLYQNTDKHVFLLALFSNKLFSQNWGVFK